MRYNWQQPDWPKFRFDTSKFGKRLLDFTEHVGRVGGLLEGIPDDLEKEAVLDLMIAEAIKSSAIEGETLNPAEVMSSIKNHLGFNSPVQPVKNDLANGAGELMVAVRSSFAEPLTEETLFEWHQMLLRNSQQICVGEWRSGDSPMQVVSGRIDRPTVHFEAPPSDNVPAEMKRFIRWFNDTAPGGSKPIHEAALRSGIAHLYFESIHPFEDGNGRIGRAISEKALSQAFNRPIVISLSRTIEKKRNAYYDALQSAQRGNEITPWLMYFVETALEAQRDAETQIRFVLKKSQLFQNFRDSLNERQLKVIQKMLEEGPKGFSGGMNARKYISITRCSKATATRDLQHLADIGVFISLGAGRSTRYELSL